MQTELLFELTYIILERKKVTADEMAQHFGVSRRTIYRWLDALNLAGVPVVTLKGKDGGIQLSDNYILDKVILTEQDKLEILSGVQALQVLSGGQNSIVSKLKAITKMNADWIQVDFSPWNPKGEEIKFLFEKIKSAVFTHRKIQFDYYSSKGECSQRKADPWRIIFKGQAWYLYGFCNSKKEPRYFKLNRIQNCRILSEEKAFDEDEILKNKEIQNEYKGDDESESPVVKLKLLVANSSIYRILDEFQVINIEDSEQQGFKIITMKLPEMYWLKSWLLSFGAELKILEPERLRFLINSEAQKMLN